ncbi:MAG: alternative ribosome rescue aminoacyl-tRNA hydrolase ArfB [Desulfovibrionaceae bacterium]
MIQITETVGIQDWEISYTASRASGPGGQHVNVTASRVTLWFNVAASPSLTEAQRQRVVTRLAGRVGQDGFLQVSAQSERSQAANKDEALARFVALLRKALAVARPRTATRVPKGALRRRETTNKRHAARKKDRAWRAGGDE